MTRSSRHLALAASVVSLAGCSLPSVYMRPPSFSSEKNTIYRLIKKDSCLLFEFDSGQRYSISKSMYLTAINNTSSYRESALSKLTEDQFSDNDRLQISGPLYTLLQQADLNQDFSLDSLDFLFYVLSPERKHIKNTLDVSATKFADIIHSFE